MKRRGLSSPDDIDALALTFAYPVLPSDHSHQFLKKATHQITYDPLSLAHLQGDFGSGGHQGGYDPLNINYLRR